MGAPVHEVCNAMYDDFAPPPLTQTVINLGPLKVFHISEQKS